jgi:hypothetical protein
MSADLGLIEIKILKWEEYNPRRDVKANSWFRFEHSFFENPEFFDFTQGEQLAWLYFLCCASKSKKGTFTVSVQHAERVARLETAVLNSAAVKLSELGMIQVTSRARNVDVTRTSRARIATYVRTNERTLLSESGECLESKAEPEPKPNPLAGLDQAIAEWGVSLKFWGRSRDPGTDGVEIGRLLKRYGLERTLNALRGFRAEVESKTYDPRKFLNIARLMKPEKFAHLEALGESLAAKPKRESALSDEEFARLNNPPALEAS